MAFGEGSFRSRAASLLRPATPYTTHTLGQGAHQEKGSKGSKESRVSSNTPTDTPLNEKTIIQEQQNGLDGPGLLSSRSMFQSSSSNAVSKDRAAQRIVKTIPS